MPCRINGNITKNIFSFGLNKNQICLMLHLIMISDGEGKCTINYNDMLSDMNISQGTFYTGLKFLRDNGFICYSKSGYNISVQICDYKISENSYISLNNRFFAGKEYIKLCGTELCVYLYIMRIKYMYSCSRPKNSIITLEQVSGDTGISVSAISKAMTKLVKEGYLKRERIRDIRSSTGRKVFCYELVDKWNRTVRKRKNSCESNTEKCMGTIKEMHSFTPYYSNVVRLLCRKNKCIIPNAKALTDCGEISNLYYRACIKSDKNILDAIKSSIKKLAGKTLIGGVFNRIMKNYVNCDSNNILFT